MKKESNIYFVIKNRHGDFYSSRSNRISYAPFAENAVVADKFNTLDEAVKTALLLRESLSSIKLTIGTVEIKELDDILTLEGEPTTLVGEPLIAEEYKGGWF